MHIHGINRVCFFACLLVFVASTGIAAEKKVDVYQIDLKVLVTQGQSFEIEAGNVVPDDDPFFIGGIDAISIGDIRLDLDADKIWNGKASPPEDSKIEVLTTPSLRVEENGQAVLRSATTVQYFQKAGEDCYTIHTLPPETSPGVFVEVFPRKGPDREDGAETVELDLTLKVNTIGGRASVPGVWIGFEVGAPTMSSKEMVSKHLYSLGRWHAIGTFLSRGPERETLLVLLRATGVIDIRR